MIWKRFSKVCKLTYKLYAQWWFTSEILSRKSKSSIRQYKFDNRFNATLAMIIKLHVN